MLDTTTKKRIDDCRDILVGKLPDPKAQIEQITIALIYKFMDDMDKEAIELGGTAKFFSGNFEKYSWDNLFDTKVTASEMLTLYSDAIASMDKNPNIPQLFRDIFKNAFLPYRDPETLKLFLKTIGEFEYTHSEKLGDAFEYLLSVMGSQGDAGQFRTPRHIIDFLVAVVDPSKTDTILDPACGTAGFLISAFKHIKEKNNNELTPDERKRLIQNFVGYDISPDMVRLSLVNLYLHGFSDPHIWEYDTLSSEDRWNETFDVILANPPFMSPKGGIRPHKKFSISSNRSEVLFVDYIAEHLNPKGKAGIIVPEGVIFQSGTAYKDLRKMLVDNYLYAVVSLPAGVFNPYSGVKTSILLMDKESAKTNEEILFVKIDNDGFGLGAQRNAIKGSQLSEAIVVLKQFKEGTFTESGLAHSVPKAEIAKNGDYNLSGERYKTTRNIELSEFPHVSLGECCNIYNGSTPSKTNEEYWLNGQIPWFTVEDIRKNGRIILETTQKITEKALNETSVKLLPPETVLLCCTASVGEYAFTKIALTTNQQFNGLVVNDAYKDKLLPKFLFYLSSAFKNELIRISGQTSFNFVSVSVLKTLQIPLPPLFIQEEIVAEIEGYQKIIDGAKMVVENYKPKIDIDPDWEMVELGEVIDDLETGVSVNSEDGIGKYGVLKTSAVTYGLFIPNECKTIISSELDRAKCNPRKDSIIISRMNTENLVGASVYIDKDYENLFLPDRLWQTIISRKDVSVKFVQLVIASEEYRKKISDICGGTSGSMKNISKKNFLSLSIPLPPLEIQRQIVSHIEKEQELVNSNKQLIELFEQKIKDRIAKVWGE